MALSYTNFLNLKFDNSNLSSAKFKTLKLVLFLKKLVCIRKKGGLKSGLFAIQHQWFTSWISSKIHKLFFFSVRYNLKIKLIFPFYYGILISIKNYTSTLSKALLRCSNTKKTASYLSNENRNPLTNLNKFSIPWSQIWNFLVLFI